MPLPQNHLDLPKPAYILSRSYFRPGKFSWASELRHLISGKFLNILWWPVFKFHQRWFTYSKLFLSCKNLPQFTDLWKTIQKGSFAYNTLFLKKIPFRRSETDLADITTLTLFFGDEFIDGIAAEAGKPFILQLVRNDPRKFYLHTKIKSRQVLLEYQFDLYRLLPKEVMQKTNSKYQITYERFYELLKCLLHVINEYLGRLPFAKAEKAALKIADAANTCFESFMHDVGTCLLLNNMPPVADVLFFHETKTAYMQKKLLELRCILVNNEEAMNNVHTPGWLDIMRVIQIYDDIQDAIIDDELQDNLLLSTACHYFPYEWQWFCTHKTSLKQTEETPLLLSLYMPCSMEYCLQLASDKIKAMNWEQQKIMHYLLFKTKYILYREKMDKNFAVRGKFLLQFYMRSKGRMSHLQEQVIKSNAINICVHITRERKQLLKKLDFTTAYQLRYNLLSVSAETKAAIFDAVTANQSIC